MQAGLPKKFTLGIVNLGSATRVTPEKELPDDLGYSRVRRKRGAMGGRQRDVCSKKRAKILREAGFLHFVFRARHMMQQLITPIEVTEELL